MPLERSVVESEIGRALLEQWDPLGVHANPGVHREYDPYVADVYGLLARGASDVQIARHLHRIERDQLGVAGIEDRDLTPVLRTLRQLERRF